MIEKEALYLGRKTKFEEELKQVKSRLNGAALLRLAVFVAAAVGIYFYHDPLSIAVAIALLGIGIFLFLIRQFADLRNNKERLSALVDVNHVEAQAATFQLEDIDDGKGYLDGHHPYSFDLDIFGKGSIFQYLNRTATLVGKHTLAAWLAQPLMDSASILKRQQAVQELSPMLDWRQELQAVGALAKEQTDERENLKKWMAQPPIMADNGIWKILRFLLPAVTLGIFGLAIFDIVSWNIATGLFVFQLSVVLSFNSRIMLLHAQLGRQVAMLEKYGRVLQIIEGTSFQSVRLQELKEILNRNSVSAATRLSQLSRIMARLDSRSNILGAIVTNGFILWDIHTVFALEQWKKENHEDPGHWFSVAGEVDALCSLANMAFNRPDFVYPEPQPSFTLEAIDAGHPLLKEKIRVDNDFTINGVGQILLTTGANMAGKSTFLRTIGVNLVLAMAGAPVCAKVFKFTPVSLTTAMRTHDSLQQQESFFHAELKRLKMIIDRLREGDTVFVLLDEMLKGTNSSDQHTGSKALIEQLIRLNACGLVATHDLQLGELETEYPSNVQNVCFEIAIVNDELVFDYKLRKGISRNLNATFLMKKMGITV